MVTLKFSNSIKKITKINKHGGLCFIFYVTSLRNILVNKQIIPSVLLFTSYLCDRYACVVSSLVDVRSFKNLLRLILFTCGTFGITELGVTEVVPLYFILVLVHYIHLITSASLFIVELFL